MKELMRQIDGHDRAPAPDFSGAPGAGAGQPVRGPLLPQQLQEDDQRLPLILLDFPQANGKTMATRLVGQFFPPSDIEELTFGARTWEGKIVELPGAVYQDRLLPLVEVLQEKNCELELSGVTDEDIFSVNEIRAVLPDPDSPKPYDITNDQLQVMLARLLGRPLPHTDIPPFSMPDDLRLLYRVCKNDYPPSLQRWAEQSFSSLAEPGQSATNRRHVVRALTYVLNIDWTVKPLHVPEIAEVRTELDRRFYGLDSVKQRILEIAAQLRNTQSLPKYGVLLNGPAGAGKTSAAHAIAEILNLPKAYLEFSVLRDSEQIAGTSRVFENGRPGQIIEQLYTNRTANLVFILNELDKAAENRQGSSPLDVLLPLLDGMGFTDNYIEMAIPTNGIFFIATANDADKLSKPILDRFFRIDIPAYTSTEKAAIFDRHILPQTLEQARLAEGEVTFTEEARTCLLESYALEPGVRDLEQLTEKLVSHYLLKREEEGLDRITFTKTDLLTILGPPRGVIKRNFIARPGMAFGAYCLDGQAHTFMLQAAVRPGKGRFETINIGIRQREYCRLAYEAVNQLTGGKLRRADVVLAAADPLHDGPSGNYIGCAACAAILSALQNRAYASSDLFLGGCDLYGCLYLDDASIDPYLELSQFRSIYTAVGAAELIYRPHPQLSVNIVEAPDISVLLQAVRIPGPLL